MNLPHLIFNFLSKIFFTTRLEKKNSGRGKIFIIKNKNQVRLKLEKAINTIFKKVNKWASTDVNYINLINGLFNYRGVSVLFNHPHSNFTMFKIVSTSFK